MKHMPAPATVGILGQSGGYKSLARDRFEEPLGPYTIASNSANEVGRDIKLTLVP